MEIDNYNETINHDYFAIVIVSFDNNKWVNYKKMIIIGKF